jgi:hypothetical protein
MNTNRNKLALRKHSIRMLTADELRIAHGGEHTVSNGTTTRATTVPTSATSRQKTAPPPPPPPPKI